MRMRVDPFVQENKIGPEPLRIIALARQCNLAESSDSGVVTSVTTATLLQPGVEFRLFNVTTERGDIVSRPDATAEGKICAISSNTLFHLPNSH